MEAINFSNLGYIKYPNNVCTYNYYKYPRTNNNNDNLKEAIDLIKKSVENEKEDAKFYELLLSLTTDKEDIDIINSIISDEKKHRKMLMDLYYELTQNRLLESRNSSMIDNMLNYRKNLQKALMGELDVVKKYRKIMAAMPDKEKYSVIMEILTDELRHANLYNFLITKSMQMV